MDRLSIVLILALALFLRVYKLDELMMFIGDFAWFYLSARDMLLTGNIPLIGITASHTWLHQGALWTYLLSIPLFLFKFNPISGAYFTAILGVATVFLIYIIGSEMFSRRVGLITAALYSTSPIVIIHARMPYHTSPIPLITLLFLFALYRWIKGRAYFLPLVTFTLGILYNLEFATVIFWIIFLLVFAYCLIKKRRWLKRMMRPEIVFLSFVSFLIPMIPMILYDFQQNTGFYQITAFLRLIKIYFLSSPQLLNLDSFAHVFSYLFIYNQRLIFLIDGPIALFITIASFVYLFSFLYTNYKHGNMIRAYMLLSLWICIPLFGIIVSRTPSEAYIPVMFPAIIFSVALGLDYLYKLRPFVFMLVFASIVLLNSYSLIAKNYLMGDSGKYGMPFSQRLSVAKEIVKEADGREHNIIGRGEGSQFRSFTMNYEYLTWWLGGKVSDDPEMVQFIIQEKEGKILVE